MFFPLSTTGQGKKTQRIGLNLPRTKRIILRLPGSRDFNESRDVSIGTMNLYDYSNDLRE